jgi:hypothetical protein
MTARAGTGPEAFPIQAAENEGMPTPRKVPGPGRNPGRLSTGKPGPSGHDLAHQEEKT